MDSSLKQKWIEQDQLVKDFENTLLIPEEDLSDVPSILVKIPKDLEAIPQKGGCYWIWTNEPVEHKLHKNRIPITLDGSSIIYNGIAQDNVMARIKHHLFGDIHQGWSGISMDLISFTPKSHAKKAMSTEKGKKVAFLLNDTRINNKELLKQLPLSDEEMKIVNTTSSTEIYFRNGIDIREEKHKSFDFVVYYISGLESTTYMEYIEKTWRNKYYTPRLCSYKSGR